MAGINSLKVSLTKNGFHKVADVIQKHSRHDVLANINGTYPGINLERAQIINMLSGDPDTGKLPEVWDEIKAYGEQQIRALVFISILYSHHKLIEQFANAKTGEMRGTLRRATFNDEKGYTNIAYTMQAFGICRVISGAASLDYTFSKVFADMQIGPLAKKIIVKKLEQTGWKEPPADDEFHRTFYEQCIHYRFNEALALSPVQFESWLEGRKVEVTAPPVFTVSDAAVDVSAKLVSALATKPFVILCGTSGTGKTTSIRSLVSSLAPPASHRYFNHAFIPVEAGWTDGRHLLGYKNPFGQDGENYSWTPIIEVLLRANFSTYDSVPFFIILDEMNLSYVEMYFSKFLSIMETSTSENPEPIVGPEVIQLMLRSGMLEPEMATMADAAISKGGLFLSPNVFIVGTVNIDETTHSFSPKVLDRAFVIEVGHNKPSAHGKTFEIAKEDRLNMSARKLADLLIAKKEPMAEDVEFSDFLDSVFSKLENFKFGPRVTNEVRKYAAVVDSLSDLPGCPAEFASQMTLRDRLMMQKILPKFSGNRAQLGKVLDQLLLLQEIRQLPETSLKLTKMRENLGPLGATSFFN